MPPSERIDPERFKATIAAGVKEVETRLALRRADLDKAWADLDNQWPGLQLRMAAMGIVKKVPLDELTMELNVRGSLVNFRRPLVEASKHAGSPYVLASLFDSVWDARLPRDKDGRMVLDDSPICVKHLLHKVLAGSVAATITQGMTDGIPADEIPYLPCVSRVLGLSPKPAPDAMLMRGGSTILGPCEVALATEEIQKWIPGNPQELKLLYRASRDGWDPDKVRAGCGAAAPTISLVRVMTRDTGRNYSVVGGFSSVSFAPLSPEGDWRNRHCRIVTESRPFAIPDGSPFLKLNGRRVTEIEIFEVIKDTTVSPPPAKRARRSSEVRLVDNTTIDVPTLITAQAASDDLHHFGALIAGPLKEEQIALFHAQTALVQASKRAAASALALEAVYGPEVAAGKKDDVVELSVRGIRMTTLRSTLQACPESALAARFDREKWAPTDKDLDEDGRQVVDCRPSCFSKVLDVLRMRKRAEWAGDDWKKGWAGSTRVGIKAADRGEFEEFVHIHFPGCERFIMDCVESRAESMA
eukprot:g7302.t1